MIMELEEKEGLSEDEQEIHDIKNKILTELKERMDEFSNVLCSMNNGKKGPEEVLWGIMGDCEGLNENIRKIVEEEIKIEMETFYWAREYYTEISQQENPEFTQEEVQAKLTDRITRVIMPIILTKYYHSDEHSPISLIEAVDELEYKGSFGVLNPIKLYMYNKGIEIKNLNQEKEKLEEKHREEMAKLEEKHRGEMESFKKEVMDRVDKWMKEVMETIKRMPVIGKMAAKRVQKRTEGLPETPSGR